MTPRDEKGRLLLDCGHRHHLDHSHDPYHERSPLILNSCRHVLKPNGSIIGRDMAAAILPNFPTLLSAIPSGRQLALRSIDGRPGISHQRLRQFVRDFGAQLHAMGYGKGDRIALVLPNGPELALAILGVSQWASSVPLNATAPELASDLQRCGAALVIGLAPASASDPSAVRDCALSLGIPFAGVLSSATEAGIFDLQPPLTTRFGTKFQHDAAPNAAEDEVLVLFTSGTTGSKKLVPHAQADILVAAACIGLSWDLQPFDVCLNMMPLFHGSSVESSLPPILVWLSCDAHSRFSYLAHFSRGHYTTSLFTHFRRRQCDLLPLLLSQHVLGAAATKADLYVVLCGSDHAPTYFEVRTGRGVFREWQQRLRPANDCQCGRWSLA